MGGKIALGVAAAKPVNLKGLVLLAPSPPSPEPIPDAVRARMLATHGTREAALQTLSGAWRREITGENLENAIAANLAMSAIDWKNWLELGSREDVSELLALIQIPVLVLTGDADAGMTPELMRQEIVSKIHGARLEIIPDAGHFLPLEVPEAVAGHLAEFVKGLGEREA